MLRRLAWWVFVAGIVLFVVKHPGPAAHAVKGFAGGIGAFFANLTV